MPDQRKIIDARGDEDGDTTHVLFKGNSRFTSVEIAIPMGGWLMLLVVRTRQKSPPLPSGERVCHEITAPDSCFVS